MAEAGSLRLLVAGFVLIAFAFQSYLTQTHIHLPPPVGVAAAKLASASDSTSAAKEIAAHPGTPSDKAPSDDNPVKCPLCQAVGYAGHFVAPSAVATLLPAAAISILPLSIAILSPCESPSHIWQGRGPPNS